MAFEIREVTIDDVLPFRIEYLLGGRPPSAVRLSGDRDEKTFHLGAYLDGQLVGIASFLSEAKSDWKIVNQYRLRQMAVMTKHNRKGYGKELLERGIALLQERGCQLLWCDARQAAFGFYQKLGFAFHGPEFEVPKIGSHKVMVRFL